MTLHIHSITEIDPSDLRSLVIEQLDTLLGHSARLVESIPLIEGCCLATSDKKDAPVLLSFDLHDPQRALLAGLAKLDQLSSETAALFIQNFQPPAELLVLAPAAPPGQVLFHGSCPISWRRIQVLSVNGELGMMIEPAVTSITAAASTSMAPVPRIIEHEFSPEEERHFSQL